MRHLLVVALVLAVSPAVAQDKEKLSANDVSVRTALAFKAPDAAVQKLLPAGFELNAPTAGPNTGSNFGITLIDYLLSPGAGPGGQALAAPHDVRNEHSG